MNRSQRSTEKFLSLMERCGKSFADLESEGAIRPAQLKLLQAGDFGNVRMLTLIDLADVLGCSLTDVVVAMGKDPAQQSERE